MRRILMVALALAVPELAKAASDEQQVVDDAVVAVQHLSIGSGVAAMLYKVASR